ncbi:RsmD family RNA methyltransferase [Empedobacter sp. 225-1]|uniref:RsmD family RNA methyltransferase n=1 Tax=unclassified Empedobacter TaxID=2643773 RepID=UPI002574CBA7|nr:MULTISPECIES: RsmD family RNA methyltransferase [unclassified Empedobacter]MDM1523454.1 RsmD family RNA methyltransferase [Empedobacter sp. 225-1]MDM1543396.1 RsmD family RNA methyltransferase [Empedobacter sp. 189-2]
MNQNILTQEFQDYLKIIKQEDFKSISLKKSLFDGISSAEIAQQLKGIQVAKHKFPTLYSTKNIYFPPSINLEQASSEAAANYKSSLVKGKTLIDLTAGFGIDTMAFAKNFEKVYHIEQNPELSEIVQHNAQILAPNLETYTGTFQSFFETNPESKFDVIYLDPARRNSSGRKFILEDLEPNILEWMPTFFEKSNKIIIKLSPLLDITSTLQQIDSISEIHIVALKNEVKDFLLIIDKNCSTKNPLIKAINLESNQPEFSFNFEDEYNSNANFGTVQQYIYEPNVAILKTGAFKLLCEKFNLYKLHQNTHLYTSNELLNEFPGKIYSVEKHINHPKKEILKSKANLLVKNYNQAIDVVKKKFKITDGGETTLIFTQSIYGFHILKTSRV